MKALKSVLLAGCVGFAAAMLSCPVMPAHASDGLPPAVKQQVDVAVGRWSASGNAAQAGAAIADLCNQPGVALDIVAYAGEMAARAQLPERCLMSSSTCQELDQLLALLFERSMQLAGGRIVLAALPTATPTGAATTPPAAVLPVPTPPPATDGGAVQGGDTAALPPAGPSAGPPDGQTGGNTGGGGPVGGESGGVVPCQATGTCGGEPPPASYTSL